MSWFKRDRTRDSRSLSSSPSPQRTLNSSLSTTGATSEVVMTAPPAYRDADPETRLEVFKCHWLQAVTVMNKANMAGPANKRNSVIEEIEAVTHYADQMMLLLVDDCGDNNQQGPVLQYLLCEDILEKFLTWSTRTGNYSDSLKLRQLKMYDMLVSQAKQPLLVHKPVVRPLLKLLSRCADPTSPEIERFLILLLHQLCVCVTQNSQLLELLFDASSDHGPARFLMFSLLIPYVHRVGPIGQQARDALLLIMALSSQNQSIGQYIAKNSDFCPVLATGLSGLYSSLPRKLDIPYDDWNHLTEEDVQAMPDLIQFLNSLEFCNAVVQVAHSLVKEQLLTFIYNGFLVPVIGPALHQNEIILIENVSNKDSVDPHCTNINDDDNSLIEDEELSLYLPDAPPIPKKKSSMEEVIAATAYLELFVRKVTEPAMMQTFMKFILTEKHDEHQIIDSLIMRINSNSRLCMVSLSLFRSLIDLNCEDVMFQLIFKYLVPCTHVMVSQRRSVKDLDLYGKTAEKFISLIPACCIPDVTDTPPESDSAPGAPGSPSGSNSSSTNSMLPPAIEDYFDLPSPRSMPDAFSNPTASLSRSVSVDQESAKPKRATKYYYKPKIQRGRSTTIQEIDFSDRSSSPDMHNLNLLQGMGTRLEHFETSYLEYLDAAHKRIFGCAKACSCWTAPYDGDNPAPESMLQSPESPIENAIPNISSNTQVTPTETSNCDNMNANTPPSTEPSNVNEAGDSSAVNTSEAPNSEQDKQSQPQDNSETNQSQPSDSPVDDNQHSDLNSFLLYLKRIQTPVETSGSIEDSIHEIDNLISDIRHHESAQQNTKANSEPLPTFSDTINNNSGLVRPDAKRTDSEGTMVTSTDSVTSKEVLNNKHNDESSTGFTTPVSKSPTSVTNTAIPPNKYALGAPNIGPFLTTILGKLETMMQNSLYVNLLLTGVVTRMACYPQPLLRSFLLNHTLVFQPTVKSLVQVLGSVKHKVDCYSYTVKDFESLLLKARRFLVWREEMYLQGQDPTSRQRSDSTQSLPVGKGRGTIEQHKERRRSSALGDFFFRRNRSKDKKPQPRLQHIGDGRFKYVNKTVPANNDNIQMESVKTKNAVYCALILEEFLKELAALSQEHAVLVQCTS